MSFLGLDDSELIEDEIQDEIEEGNSYGVQEEDREKDWNLNVPLSDDFFVNDETAEASQEMNIGTQAQDQNSSSICDREFENYELAPTDNDGYTNYEQVPDEVENMIPAELPTVTVSDLEPETSGFKQILAIQQELAALDDPSTISLGADENELKKIEEMIQKLNMFSKNLCTLRREFQQKKKELMAEINIESENATDERVEQRENSTENAQSAETVQMNEAVEDELNAGGNGTLAGSSGEQAETTNKSKEVASSEENLEEEEEDVELENITKGDLKQAVFKKLKQLRQQQIKKVSALNRSHTLPRGITVFTPEHTWEAILKNAKETDTELDMPASNKLKRAYGLKIALNQRKYQQSLDRIAKTAEDEGYKQTN